MGGNRLQECNHHRLVLLRGEPMRMRQDMAGRVVTLLLILPVLAAGTEDEENLEIFILKSPAGFLVTLEWNLRCPSQTSEPRHVSFKAAYKKLGAPDSESRTCDISEDCTCWIPSAVLDHSHNYTLLVTATTPEGETVSDYQDFYPNSKTKPPPVFDVTSSDALVVVSVQDFEYNEEYNLTLRRNDSAEEGTAIFRSPRYLIPPSELLPEQTYCVKMTAYNVYTMEMSPFSPEKCFTSPAQGPPRNLTMDALDLTYLLKWDWDHNQAPNVTFSVEKCVNYNGCNPIKGCENISTAKCNCSGLAFIGKFMFRVSMYDGQRKEKSSSVISFSPSEETVFGPPKDLKMIIKDHKLFINVTAPEGFRHTEIYNYCPWLTSLSYWTNSTEKREVTLEDKQPFYTIDSLEASTTYCAKAKMKCEKSERSSLYSREYCITTDPKSYLVAWIIGFTFLGIVVLSVGLYLCFCPFQRYLKRIFFPSSKLPSIFEKDLGYPPLDCTRHPFLSHAEETTDRCYIVQNSLTEDLAHVNYNKTSHANSQDSGNYSHEGQTTGDTFTQ